MSEKLTSIKLPGVFGSGICQLGHRPIGDMINEIRAYAKDRKDAAEKILSAPAEDFRIETYEGPYARRNLKVLQPGRRK